MKRLLIACLTTFVAITSMGADSLSIRQLFAEMPDSVIPYLTKNNRLDFMDFMDSNMKAEVTNELGGKSLMTVLSDDSITVRLNESCTLDLLLLDAQQPVDNVNKVICLVRTFMRDTDMVTSSVAFYSVKWAPLPERPMLTDEAEKCLLIRLKRLNIIESLSKRLNKY